MNSHAAARAEPSIAGVGDYIALLKPRVMSLVVFTALVGLSIAPGHVHPVIGFTALLCIAVGAGAAAALNMCYDADIDARMARTAGRPIPQGRVAPGATFDPWHFPLLNTLILLTSGTTVTWAHHALLENNRKGLIWGLVCTIALGVTFTCVQAYEYGRFALDYAAAVRAAARASCLRAS